MSDENIARLYLDKNEPEATRRAAAFASLSVREQVKELRKDVEKLETVLREINKTLIQINEKMSSK